MARPGVPFPGVVLAQESGYRSACPLLAALFSTSQTCRCRCRCGPSLERGLSLLSVVKVLVRRDRAIVERLEGLGNFVVAVAGSLADVLVDWLLLLLLLLLLCLAPGSAANSLACGPGDSTTAHGAMAGSQALHVANDGGEGLGRALRPVPFAGAGDPAGVVARAAAAAVAAARTVSAAHLTVARVLQM